MAEFFPHQVTKDSEGEFAPPPAPPQEMVPTPREPEAAELLPDTETPTRRRKIGKWIAGTLSGVVLLGGAGFIGAKLSREAGGNSLPPENPETTTSASQIPGPVETTTATQETRTEKYSEITPNTRVFATNNMMTFNEAKDKLMDVSLGEAPSEQEAKRQFHVILRNGANANTEAPAQDIRGGKDGLIEFNKKLLPKLLEDTGIQPGSDAYGLIERLNTANIKDGTYAKFAQTGGEIKAERYRRIGPNEEELVESKTFKVTGDPKPNAQLDLWEYPGFKLAEQKK